MADCGEGYSLGTLVSPERRRRAADVACEVCGLSQRTACRIRRLLNESETISNVRMDYCQ